MNVLKLAVIAGIAAVVAVIAGVGMSSAYTTPDGQEFCVPLLGIPYCGSWT